MPVCEEILERWVDLNFREVRLICAMMEAGLSNRKIMKILRRANIEISRFNIFDIRKRKSWRHITKHYDY